MRCNWIRNIFRIRGTSLVLAKDDLEVSLKQKNRICFCHGTKLVCIVSFSVMDDEVVTVMKVTTLKG